MRPDLHEEIAKLAYEIFEREGRVHGRDLDHWLQAERIVMARYESHQMIEIKEEEPKAEKKKKKTKAKPEEKKGEKKKKTQEEKGEKKVTRSKKKS